MHVFHNEMAGLRRIRMRENVEIPQEKWQRFRAGRNGSREHVIEIDDGRRKRADRNANVGQPRIRIAIAGGGVPTSGHRDLTGPHDRLPPELAHDPLASQSYINDKIVAVDRRVRARCVNARTNRCRHAEARQRSQHAAPMEGAVGMRLDVVFDDRAPIDVAYECDPVLFRNIIGVKANNPKLVVGCGHEHAANCYRGADCKQSCRQAPLFLVVSRPQSVHVICVKC